MEITICIIQQLFNIMVLQHDNHFIALSKWPSPFGLVIPACFPNMIPMHLLIVSIFSLFDSTPGALLVIGYGSLDLLPSVIYTMEYYSAEKKNDIIKYAGKWMELEKIIVSEVTQIQKDKYELFFDD
ncbi:hypothetical protein STEG23_005065 [Scotinomys teguina]